MTGSSLQGSRRGQRRFLRSFERAVLGFGMSFVAFFIERRLIKAIKKGGIQSAPRTASESDAFAGESPAAEQTGEITAHSRG